MALPERGRAAGWVGHTVVDRDGTEIGSCTAVYADDATGLTEWMSVGFGGRSVIVPVIDAAERGGRVHVAVGCAEVASAPSVDDGQHVFGDEEVALYRHYGIEYSRAVSDTVLPAGEAPSEGAGSGSATAFRGPGSDETPSAQRGPRLAAAAAALTALLTVVAAVVRLRRRASRRPPERRRPADEAARRARTASVHVTRRARQLAGATAPLLATAGRVSVAGARTGAGAAGQAAHAAVRSTGSAASRAAGRAGAVVQAGVQVGRRVGGAVESVPEEVLEGGHRIRKLWRRGTSRLSAGVGFAAGYVLGARAGRQRFEQIKHAASTVARRPEVQQALQRVKASAAPTQDDGRAGAHQPTAPPTARLREPLAMPQPASDHPDGPPR